MNRFQKVLFTLAAVIALGWASTASAQVTFLVSPSGARPVRSEGLAEATGTVGFAANSGGTLKATTTISLDYGATVIGGTVSTTCGGITGAISTAAGSATVNSAGSYTVPPANPVTASGGNGTGATFNLTKSVIAAAIVSGGTGYTNGDVLTVVGGSGAPAATVVVTTAVAGVITVLGAITPGTYAGAVPANPVATTVAPVGGTGATLNLTWNAINPVAVAGGGSGYLAGNILTVNGGTGTIATTLNVVTIAAAAPGGTLIRTTSGNVLTITLTGGDLTCNVGQSITVSGARVNANALGAGANVNPVVTVAVPAAFQTTNAVQLAVFGTLTVATVQAAPSTTARIVSPPGPGSLLFCVLTTATTVNVLVEVTERFAQAFLSQTDETGLGPDGLGGTPAKFKLRYTLSGIPVGARVTPTVVLGLPSTSTTLTFVAMDPLTYLSASGAQDNDFDLEITKTDTTVIELVTVNFAIQVPDVSDSAFPKVEASANLRILLRGATDSPEAPRFSTAAASRQLDATAFRSLACASYLLFPWVANTGDGAVDTGLAIANTTADPPQIGSLPQKGDVTLHFWRSAGGTNPAPLKIATALEAGRTATYVISALGAPFQGYVIAVCTFQMGHGIAAFLSGGSFNAFTAISLLNPRVLGGATEQVGH